jgi:hypothetical protein
MRGAMAMAIVAATAQRSGSFPPTGVHAMQRPILVSLTVMLLAGGLAIAPAAAQQSTHHRTTRKSTGKSSDSTYMVVKIGDKYKAFATRSYNDEKKNLEKENKKREDKWKDERKIDPQAERPQKLFMVVKKRGFNSSEMANKYIKKLEEEDAGLDTKDGDKSDDKSKDKKK